MSSSLFTLFSVKNLSEWRRATVTLTLKIHSLAVIVKFQSICCNAQHFFLVRSHFTEEGVCWTFSSISSPSRTPASTSGSKASCEPCEVRPLGDESTRAQHYS